MTEEAILGIVASPRKFVRLAPLQEIAMARPGPLEPAYAARRAGHDAVVFQFGRQHGFLVAIAADAGCLEILELEMLDQLADQPDRFSLVVIECRSHVHPVLKRPPGS